MMVVPNTALTWLYVCVRVRVSTDELVLEQLVLLRCGFPARSSGLLVARVVRSCALFVPLGVAADFVASDTLSGTLRCPQC